MSKLRDLKAAGCTKVFRELPSSVFDWFTSWRRLRGRKPCGLDQLWPPERQRLLRPDTVTPDPEDSLAGRTSRFRNRQRPGPASRSPPRTSCDRSSVSCVDKPSDLPPWRRRCPPSGGRDRLRLGRRCHEGNEGIANSLLNRVCCRPVEHHPVDHGPDNDTVAHEIPNAVGDIR